MRQKWNIRAVGDTSWLAVRSRRESPYFAELGMRI